jgi:hypothetical protein
VVLTSAASLGTGQFAVDTTGRLTDASMLLVESARTGSSYVTQVVTYDANGDYQVVNVNQMVSPQNPTVQVPLTSGAGSTRVVVDGHSEWGGAIALAAT